MYIFKYKTTDGFLNLAQHQDLHQKSKWCTLKWLIFAYVFTTPHILVCIKYKPLLINLYICLFNFSQATTATTPEAAGTAG